MNTVTELMGESATAVIADTDISDMSEATAPGPRVKCTYKNCMEFFDTEKAMRRHKKYSDEHDYCYRCNEDCKDFEDLMQHKITSPEQHGKACRFCGEEFKTVSGLKRHIELCHKINQKLKCFSCGREFHRGSWFIQHIEFSECEGIPKTQFLGHIVHKHLITELLQGGPAYDRFVQKTAKYDAAMDNETEGGIDLNLDMMDGGGGIEEVHDEYIEPEVSPILDNSATNRAPPVQYEPFPALSSHSKPGHRQDGMASAFNSLSLDETNQTSPWHKAPEFQLSSWDRKEPTPKEAAEGGKNQEKVWGQRKGKTASNVLFPGAKPTPATQDFAIAAGTNNDLTPRSRVLNMMNHRFWDPMSPDWVPERFYDSAASKYHCPFPCEQTFDTPADVRPHILDVHRVLRNKCPRCQKSFNSVTALVAHCETKSPRCNIAEASDYEIVLDKLTGGFLGAREKIRPDHEDNPTVLIKDHKTEGMKRYAPPVSNYMKYTVTKPPDWEEPAEVMRIGRSHW